MIKVKRTKTGSGMTSPVGYYRLGQSYPRTSTRQYYPFRQTVSVFSTTLVQIQAYINQSLRTPLQELSGVGRTEVFGDVVCRATAVTTNNSAITYTTKGGDIHALPGGEPVNLAKLYSRYCYRLDNRQYYGKKP